MFLTHNTYETHNRNTTVYGHFSFAALSLDPDCMLHTCHTHTHMHCFNGHFLSEHGLVNLPRDSLQCFDSVDWVTGKVV